MVIAIAGKNNIAVDSFEYIYKKYSNYFDIVVVCNKNENGVNSWQKSLRLIAKQYDIKEVFLEDLYDIEDLLFLSLEFDTIIKTKRFKSKKLFNIHFSLLPKYKGMYTSAIPILNDEKKTGVTLHKIEDGIDTGDIVAQKEFDIYDYDTSRNLYIKYIQHATVLVKENIEKLIYDHENIKYTQQDWEHSSYYSKNYIDYKNLSIDLNQTSRSIYNQLRAFTFREYQLPMVYNKRIVMSQITNIKSYKKPGTILFECEYSLMIATIDYNIILFIDRFEELLKECQKGNISKVKEICSINQLVNEKDYHGWTPLMVATYNGHTEVVKYLISVGANIYDVNNNGTNLLMYAKEAFRKTGNVELFELYINLGIDYNIKDYYNKSLIDYCREDNIKNIGIIQLF
ncbi:formyltransferase family protein [Anaeromicropila herbilytica]|uniref:Formyl transferase N-terminal domain-containing protein n=1 Tax=Anaeromicropila herbilytica TaxID=2785025 RepID=A0A7R7EP79_9FIRM|nr:formyltransferase family protein [Anaeromicropila herbilytica]BCN32520.1 hypothetical protein bsdtb5_38150 [Anaeromicropila herbilytica]